VCGFARPKIDVAVFVGITFAGSVTGSDALVQPSMFWLSDLRGPR
jgi:hypothetical protein